MQQPLWQHKPVPQAAGAKSAVLLVQRYMNMDATAVSRLRPAALAAAALAAAASASAGQPGRPLDVNAADRVSNTATPAALLFAKGVVIRMAAVGLPWACAWLNAAALHPERVSGTRMWSKLAFEISRVTCVQFMWTSTVREGGVLAYRRNFLVFCVGAQRRHASLGGNGKI